VYEESVRGTLVQVLAHFKETAPKGEFVIVLAGKEKERKRKDINEEQHSSKYNENR
jgi:S-adenosylmethionine-dependent methyltransferase, yraL family